MSSPAPVYQHDLSDLRWLAVKAEVASPGALKGKKGVRLENGLLTIPNLDLPSGAIEVEIAAPGPAYPGIAFRILDPLNFDLAYTQPHCSGLWDAIQYDPVFHGSNTWQVFHGEAFQQRASIPTGDWYSFRVEFQGNWARATIDGQPPLVVDGLARAEVPGSVGLWTYLPAYFRNLRVYGAPMSGSEPPRIGAPPRSGEPLQLSGPTVAAGLQSVLVDQASPRAAAPKFPPGTVTEWFAENYGLVEAEQNGILLLNRYFPLTLKEVTLSRRFVLEHDAEMRMAFGFSDDIAILLDGETVFAGSHTYRPTPDRAGRGYVQPGQHKTTKKLPAGAHTVSVKVRNSEPFGWGLAFSMSAEGMELLPANAL
ncbi:MAG: hypothetical protein ACM3WU_09745 [Bacillota bacterium]